VWLEPAILQNTDTEIANRLYVTKITLALHSVLKDKTVEKKTLPLNQVRLFSGFWSNCYISHKNLILLDSSFGKSKMFKTMSGTLTPGKLSSCIMELLSG